MKSTRALPLQLIPVVIGVGLAWGLPRSEWVRQTYAERLYPIIQSTLTDLSNRTQLAWFDVTIGAATALLLVIVLMTIRRMRRGRPIRAAGRGLLAIVLLLTTIYLWFLVAWGLNYARTPLERTVAFDNSRITPVALQLLAERAVAEANRTFEVAHAEGFPAIDSTPSSLANAVREVSREFGQTAPAVVAHPKRSMLSPYFRASGVSGMLAPFFLETLVNPDLTGPERPYILAHEWAHLSGFAPEADASFVGILAALRADKASQYSAWLELVSETANQLPPSARNLVLKQLAAGPRADQAAIDVRLRALVPQVERVAWATYDRALKSQGVVEGVASYSRVVQLLLGTDALKIFS